MDRRYQRRESGVARGPAILFLLAVAIFAAGALRYYRHGNFTLVQAGDCLLMLLVSLLVLLVFDYTLHHAKIVGSDGADLCCAVSSGKPGVLRRDGIGAGGDGCGAGKRIKLPGSRDIAVIEKTKISPLMNADDTDQEEIG